MFKLPEKVPSKYLFVLLAAERAKQLQQGAAPRMRTAFTKPTYRAIDEIMQDQLEFIVLAKPDVDPEKMLTVEE